MVKTCNFLDKSYTQSLLLLWTNNQDLQIQCISQRVFFAGPQKPAKKKQFFTQLVFQKHWDMGHLQENHSYRVQLTRPARGIRFVFPNHAAIGSKSSNLSEFPITFWWLIKSFQHSLKFRTYTYIYIYCIYYVPVKNGSFLPFSKGKNDPTSEWDQHLSLSPKKSLKFMSKKIIEASLGNVHIFDPQTKIHLFDPPKKISCQGGYLW